MKMGHGLPPIEEVIAYDTEAEERELRRRGEIQKQEDMARSRVQVLDKCAISSPGNPHPARGRRVASASC